MIKNSRPIVIFISIQLISQVSKMYCIFVIIQAPSYRNNIYLILYIVLGVIFFSLTELKKIKDIKNISLQYAERSY